MVGDDDQSIYSWRGATLRNILEFEHDYKDVKVIKLEQNYRSTQAILDCAWKVIRNNRSRKEKKLWTARDRGTDPVYAVLADEIAEANLVIKEISRLMEEGYTLREIAIFYRTNAQSRALEDALRQANMDYTIVGGQKFYERKEVKDILAYLKLIINPRDSVSLKRVINTPPRGIGKKSWARLEEIAGKKGVSLYEAVKEVENWKGLPGRSVSAIKEFIELIERFAREVDNLSGKEMTKLVIEATGYLRMLEEEDTPEAHSRIENIKELVSAAGDFEETSSQKGIIPFIEQVALLTDIDTWEKKEWVTLMTLHLAKGLEFPVVFITGMEEGLLPHADSLYDDCLLYTSPSPRDLSTSRMPSSA